jgi:acetyl esterase/lipase
MTGDVRMTGEVRIEASPVGPVVHPPDPAGLVLVYLHGDRYLASAPESALGLASNLAARTGAVVVCPRYRCVFPAALEDAHAGYRYGRESACPGGPGPVVVAGERLGAGLAAALLIRLRDEGASLPHGAVLVSALLDLSLEAPSLLLNQAADPTFRLAELRQRAARYAAGTAKNDPLLSPLHANLHGLPPIQLLAAGNDVLVDDSLAFATRAARSGVTVDLRVRSDEAGLRAGLGPAVAAFVGERAAQAAFLGRLTGEA